MSGRHVVAALPRSPGDGTRGGRAARRPTGRRVVHGVTTLLGLLGLLVLLGACAEPDLEEDDTEEEVAAPAPTEVPSPEEEVLREQLRILAASVARARDHLREVAEASDLDEAQAAGDAAAAQLVADGRLSDDDPPAVLPAESVVRGDQRAEPDAVTPALSAARQVGGSFGEQVVAMLRDPIAGDLGTWERDPAGMIAQAEAVADPDTALEELDAAVLELGGDALRALTWALLAAEADDLELARAYGERGAVHLDLVLEAMAEVVEPDAADDATDDAADDADEAAEGDADTEPATDDTEDTP
jgi:hypothetical protein